MEQNAVARLAAVVLSVAVCVVCILAASDGIGGNGATTHTGLANAQRFQTIRFDIEDAERAQVFATDLGGALGATDDESRVAALGALADALHRPHVDPTSVRDAQAALAVAATIALTSERDPQTAATAVLDRFSGSPIARR